MNVFLLLRKRRQKRQEEWEKVRTADQPEGLKSTTFNILRSNFSRK